ncbi:MAG TPA: methyltransferase domain-containing protein [Synergistaceae bacterium]|nr:methyltransferase domain-containing protein [Synergistaceae bacterium]HPJ26208.1 methyltransferase domain-containing protein [Synergistaceae bacterium]HPQ37501.1 methyltransferase domain-containing protein [Synergistaceae bacterium]
MLFPYEHPRWKEVMGAFIHPGGEELSLRLLSLCDFPRGARILDLGCGAGGTLGLLRRQGANPLGVDRSESMLEQASLRGRVMPGEAEKLPLEDAILDGGICECVLSQQSEPLRVIREVKRVLKEGSLFGVTDLFSLSNHEGKTSYGERKQNALSCVQGAPSRKEMEHIFTDQDFVLLHFEDHSRFLREYAARLVWEGLLEGPGKTCFSKPLGYGLWIWEKRTFSEKPPWR